MDAVIIEKEAMSLPEAARAILADKLIESISPVSKPLQGLWVEESESRFDAFERGEIKAVDGIEALESLKTKSRR